MSSSPPDRRKQYVRIADELRAEIAAGGYPVGDLLPSMAELSDRYGVAKMTISNALGILRDEGLITTRQGSRSIVTAAPDTTHSPDKPAAEHSEEFQVLSAQLHDLRANIRRLSSRLDELDERTKDL